RGAGPRADTCPLLLRPPCPASLAVLAAHSTAGAGLCQGHTQAARRPQGGGGAARIVGHTHAIPRTTRYAGGDSRMTANKPPLLGELVAEFVGTMVLIMLGDGVVAMVVMFGPGEAVHGGYTNITLGWGLAVLMGVCVAGRVSGGHLNPAVTLALAVYRD